MDINRKKRETEATFHKNKRNNKRLITEIKIYTYIMAIVEPELVCEIYVEDAEPECFNPRLLNQCQIS